MAVTKSGVGSREFGRLPDGSRVTEYTLASPSGLEVKVLDYGATLLSVRVPDRDGRLDNVVLRLDALDDYLRGHPLLGSVVGRYANRISNAKFVLDGKEHRLTPNSGKHHIHGGAAGFHRALFRSEVLPEAEGIGVRLRHMSPDGEDGYPGALDVEVVYKVTAENELRMEYAAKTDRPTHVNLTNHAYWNLAGAGSGDVLGHVLTLNASFYLPTDAETIPTGEIRSVAGTPMDFRTPTPIGARIDAVEGRNYDHPYVADKKEPGELSFFARLADPKTGRTMEVWTTEPGAQLYTARWLSDRLGSGGRRYGPYHGVCIETQHFPDSPNRPHFPSTALRPGETYRQITVHRFGAGR